MADSSDSGCCFQVSSSSDLDFWNVCLMLTVDEDDDCDLREKNAAMMMNKTFYFLRHFAHDKVSSTFEPHFYVFY